LDVANCDIQFSAGTTTSPKRLPAEGRTVNQHFKTYEGKPLTIPAEAAGPKAEYLEYHRISVFDRS